MLYRKNESREFTAGRQLSESRFVEARIEESTELGNTNPLTESNEVNSQIQKQEMLRDAEEASMLGEFSSSTRNRPGLTTLLNKKDRLELEAKEKSKQINQVQSKETICWNVNRA